MLAWYPSAVNTVSQAAFGRASCEVCSDPGERRQRAPTAERRGQVERQASVVILKLRRHGNGAFSGQAG
jgi:hypothetical protein